MLGMINIPMRIPKSGRLLIWLLILMLSPPMVFTAESAQKYKKSTVIDFEGALVEGKSRKPYSSYLTQQKDSAFGELHAWSPDLDKRLLDAQTRLDRSQ